MKRQLLSVLALAAMSVTAAKADLFTFHVDLNLSSLAADQSQGPYALDLQFISGNQTNGQTNNVTFSNFVFSGNSASYGGSATLTGSATGSLANSVVLTSGTNALNELQQAITAGVTDIQFNVSTTRNFFANGSPDSLYVTIDDSTGVPIFTTEPGNAANLLDLNIGAANQLSDISTYSSVAPSTTGVTASVSAVPEPSSYGLLGAGALAAASFVRRRRAKIA